MEVQPPLHTNYPINDDWALLTDGTVVAIRDRDYHIDWRSLEGAGGASPKTLYDWQPLTADDKVHIIDSLEAMDAMRRAETAARGGNPVQPQRFVPAADLPDVLPPFLAPWSARGDADGNLWVMLPPWKRDAGAPGTVGPVYDILTRDGKRVDRVQLPPASSLLGFGPGVAYVWLNGHLSRLPIGSIPAVR